MRGGWKCAQVNSEVSSQDGSKAVSGYPDDVSDGEYETITVDGYQNVEESGLNTGNRPILEAEAILRARLCR